MKGLSPRIPAREENNLHFRHGGSKAAPRGDRGIINGEADPPAVNPQEVWGLTQQEDFSVVEGSPETKTTSPRKKTSHYDLGKPKTFTTDSGADQNEVRRLHLFGKRGEPGAGRALNTQLSSDFSCGLGLRKMQEEQKRMQLVQLGAWWPSSRCHSIVPSPG